MIGKHPAAGRSAHQPEKRTLVTGGADFLGSHLCERLLERGDDVAYRVGIVYIKFIGTHAQYDAVDAATVDMN